MKGQHCSPYRQCSTACPLICHQSSDSATMSRTIPSGSRRLRARYACVSLVAVAQDTFRASGGRGAPCCARHIRVLGLAAVSWWTPWVSSDHQGQGGLCCRVHCSTGRWLFTAADSVVLQSQGQSFCLAHSRIGRWPPSAAAAQVYTLQSQPFWRAHCSTARWPPLAAQVQVNELHGQPFWRTH